jgi:DNA-binding phage protein
MLKTVIDSQGGIGVISKKTGINRQHLYKMFSEDGNPTFSRFTKVLQKIVDASENLVKELKDYAIHGK